MQYDVSVGVRKANPALLAALNRVLARDRRAIDRILRGFHVPLVPNAAAGAGAPAGER